MQASAVVVQYLAPVRPSGPVLLREQRFCRVNRDVLPQPIANLLDVRVLFVQVREQQLVGFLELRLLRRQALQLGTGAGRRAELPERP